MTDVAKQQIRQIAKYIRKEFGKNRRDEFMQELRQTRRLIESNPTIGPVEPLFMERVVMYRSYVMNRLNKNRLSHWRRHNLYRRFMGRQTRSGNFGKRSEIISGLTQHNAVWVFILIDFKSDFLRFWGL